MEWGWVSAIDSEWRTIWIVDAHRDDGKRYVVRADHILMAFLELEADLRAIVVTRQEELRQAIYSSNTQTSK